MKDLDFDELDRAVNSLMTNVPKTPEPKKDDDDTVQTLTITPTIKQDSSPSFNTLDSTLSTINKSDDPMIALSSAPVQQPIEGAPAATTTTSSTTTSDHLVSSSSPVAARRGRFMDVVRPGVTITKSDTSPSRSRLGMTITPSSPSMKDVVPAPKPVTSVPARVTAASAAPLSSTPDTNDWPDPLDIDMVKKTDIVDASETVKETKDAVREEALLVPVEAPKVALEETPPAPLTSPFLADAKVEKRPLGIASTDEVLKEEKPDKKEEADVQMDPVVDMPRPALPEELSTDMAALESGADTAGVAAGTGIETAETAADASIHTPSATVEPIVTHSTLTTPEPDTKPVAASPTSIPQQYHEEPNTGDKGNGSIYDTDTYHKPLSHPAKKGSGWMWVLWIVVILLLGAGGGAALYFLHVF